MELALPALSMAAVSAADGRPEGPGNEDAERPDREQDKSQPHAGRTRDDNDGDAGFTGTPLGGRRGRGTAASQLSRFRN
jgi:hypothetical protein